MDKFVRAMFVVVALSVPAAVFAQTINSVSGQLSNGTSVTIQGSNFGSKSTAAPTIWDNVESGSFSSKWSSANQLVVGSESRHAFSQRCGTINFQGSLGQGNGFFTGGSPAQNWYAQYWFKMDNNFDWGRGHVDDNDSNLSSVKMFRLWNPGNTSENFVVYYIGESYPGELRWQVENVGTGDVQDHFDGWDEVTKGQWHLLQFQWHEGSFGGNDSVFKVWLDGTLKKVSTGKASEDDNVLKRPYILGFYNSWHDNNTDRDDFYIDDAYIDTTFSRVELGNASSYDACTHREIQPPTAWSSTQVTVAFNQGSFQSNDNAYLFVVDAAGNPSPGFPVTISQTGTSGPGQPGKPVF